MKRFVLFLVIFATCCFCMSVSAESDVKNMEKNILRDLNNLSEKSGTYWYPVQDIMKNFDVITVWDVEIEKLTASYNQTIYTGTSSLNNGQAYFYVKNESTNQLLFLNPMAQFGTYKIKDGILYFAPETMAYFLKGVGCFNDLASTYTYLDETDLFWFEETKLIVSDWAEQDVKAAIKQGIIPLLNSTDYTEEATRLDVCHWISDFLLLNLGSNTLSEKEKTPFLDTKDIKVSSLYRSGIIDGKVENYFYPYDSITREEFAKILAKAYYMRNPQEEIDICTHEYADQADISNWAVKYVQDMYSLNIMVGNSENKFNPQDNITKEEVIVTLLRICMNEENAGVNKIKY